MFCKNIHGRQDDGGVMSPAGVPAGAGLSAWAIEVSVPGMKCQLTARRRWQRQASPSKPVAGTAAPCSRQRQCRCRRLHGSYDDPRHFCKSTLSVCSIATMRPLQATRLPPYSSLSLERPPALHARTPLKRQCEHAQREGPILLCQSKLGWSGLSNRRSPEPCHRCACGGPPRGP